MANHEEHQPNRQLPYINDSLVINTRLNEIERGQKEEKKQDREYKERQLGFDRWLVVFTGLLFLTSSVSDIVLFRQTRANRDNADAAMKAGTIASNELTLSQRPWIAVKITPGPLIFVRDTAIAEFNISLSNTGHSPALNVVTSTEFVDVGISDKNPGADAQKVCAPKEIGTTLFPGDNYTERQSLMTFTEIGKQKVFQPALLACVSNAFPFTKERHTTIFYGLLVTTTHDPKVFVAPRPTFGNVPARDLRIERSGVLAD